MGVTAKNVRLEERSPNSTYTAREFEVGQRLLYSEFKTGYGPEYSIFREGHPMVEDLKNSYVVNQARELFNSGMPVNRTDIPFGLIGPFASSSMTEQFIGGARVTIIPLTSGNLIIVDNTTDKNSYYYHMANSQPRTPGKIVPEGTIHQRFIWLEPK